MMRKFEFSLGMFAGLFHDDYGKLRGSTAIGLAVTERANEILSKHLASLPVVYGNYGIEIDRAWNGVKYATDTHKAVLFNCEEIEKTPCKHEPCCMIDQPGDDSKTFKDRKWVCSKCHKSLTATWTAE